jgi:hypothetical protein
MHQTHPENFLWITDTTYGRRKIDVTSPTGLRSERGCDNNNHPEMSRKS